MDKLKNIAFVVNAGKPGAPELTEVLTGIARERGVEIRTTNHFPIPGDFLKGADACCVIGGDGTLLSVVTQAARLDVPIIGVNRGTLGFLTVFAPDEAREKFAALIDGEFHLSSRSLLQCGDDGEQVALNDIVIKEARSSRLISLDLFVDDEWVTRFSGDGLIFATPTGSTAYNLSAGGPITHPHVRVIAITPICPHTLSNRTVILEENVSLKVKNAHSDQPLSAVLDGQRTVQLDRGETLGITASPSKIRLVQPLSYSHFGVLRAKLGWNGATFTGHSRHAP